MNYIRGAVSAISAPYQYYKDLPPINPSTLTGAIDVIVIQRPTDSGDSELVCSPFHVRFGKWQVLRPGEKKVNVSVNGHPIPYSMKVGEAGEAFFVFETDEDLPEDLMTSPLLEPTRPNENVEQVPIPDIPSGQTQDSHHESLPRPKQEGLQISNADGIPNQEPDFLDLNASSTAEDDSHSKINTTPKQAFWTPSLNKKSSTRTISQARLGLPSPPPSADHSRSSTPEMDIQDQRVDAALRAIKYDFHEPVVEYHDGVALDIEGYHSHHGREHSERTIRSSDDCYDQENSEVHHPQPPSLIKSLHAGPTPPSSDEDIDHTTAYTFPSIRATSEPPPDTDYHETEISDGKIPPSTKLNTLSTSVQQYSWEWGAFPQPSPMKTTFGTGLLASPAPATWGKGIGKNRGKMHPFLSELADLGTDGSDEDIEEDHARSRSVPPDLESSPSRSRKFRELPEQHGFHRDAEVEDETQLLDLGTSGVIRPSKQDSSRFKLIIGKKKVYFELSIVPLDVEDRDSDPELGSSEMTRRGRKSRGGHGGVNMFDRHDEIEATRLFAIGKVDFARFLADDNVVADPRLVIRWAGTQYVTRQDGSPLMNALVIWRETALKNNTFMHPSRPTSPSSDEELETSEVEDRQSHNRSKSEPPEQMLQQATNGKPSSLSWVQWWSRSRRTQTDNSKALVDRPELRETYSSPARIPVKGQSSASRLVEKGTQPSGSAPALLSSPVQKPATPAPVSAEAVADKLQSRRRFAKTLRLSSDQLKALNLKAGANSITFSLSTSGVIACTARIFLWDSTDLVLISDIDGTITKSDGLGHVFAMIGRDWTHLGVAKLYTDITRNGYKIMYLTSRAIGQADSTRDYLKGIKQNNYQLPEGPVIMSPDRLMASLHREVIMRKPEVFKMACLRDIQKLFGEASRNPFYAGFGNRITDALSYRSVNVPSSRIFTIDSSGEVKLELLELAGYKSSYIHMTDLVDQMFPPIHRKWTPEFTDFNYWKAPVQEFPLPDLTPPSPALSARSDTSNQSTLARIRNFSLGGNRQNQTRPSAMFDSENDRDLRRTSTLRQATSLERISNSLAELTSSTLQATRRSLSPDSTTSSRRSYHNNNNGDGDDDGDDDSDEEEEWRLDADGQHRKRRMRRRSMTSMPGSLEDMQLDDDEEEHGDLEEGDYENEEDGEEDGDGEPEEEGFDEDLLAAGEMKNVPFL